jgi:hypothetical protein
MTKIIAILEDRKRATNEDRTKAWELYERLLRTVCDTFVIVTVLPSILQQQLRSIDRGSHSGQQHALSALSLTARYFSADSDVQIIFEQAHPVIKHLLCTPDEGDGMASNKSMALQSLTVLVLVDSGRKSDVEELAGFLLDIVASDRGSVFCLDNAPMLTSALRIWTFASFFFIPPKLLEEVAPQSKMIHPDDAEDTDGDTDDDADDEDNEVDEDMSYFTTRGALVLKVLLD